MANRHNFINKNQIGLCQADTISEIEGAKNRRLRDTISQYIHFFYRSQYIHDIYIYIYISTSPKKKASMKKREY